MRRSQLSGVVVALIETTNSDLVVLTFLCFQCIDGPKCAELRVMYPGPDSPAVGFTGEVLEVDLYGRETVRGWMGRRRSPPKTELLKTPVHVCSVPFFNDLTLFFHPLEHL